MPFLNCDPEPVINQVTNDGPFRPPNDVWHNPPPN